MPRPLLIVNPTSGGGRWSGGDRVRRRLAEIRRLLEQRGPIEIATTRGPLDATDLARSAVADRRPAVYVLGGDGTVRVVAAGLLGSPVPLGVLGGGTANVLVAALGLPNDPITCARMFGATASLPTRELDVGRCGGLPFLMMASSGTDALALQRLAPSLKRRFGRAAIIVQVLIEWLRAPPPAIEIEIAGQRSTVSFFAACNLPLYGGRFTMAPGATPFDRQLDLVGLGRGNRAAVLRFAIAVVRGRHLGLAGVFQRTASTLQLPGTGRLVVQLDGDAFELERPLTIDIAAQRLALLWPAPLPALGL